MYFLNFRKFISFRSSFILVFIFFSVNIQTIQSQKKYTVVLDAGHGGKDPGASNGGFIEKKIALKVVLEVGKQLKNSKDINVVYTRDKDVFVELHKRAAIANKKEANLFVSLHCDSFKPKPKAYGASTYVLGLRGNKTNMEIAKRENAVIMLEKDYQKNYDYDPNSPETVIGLSVLQEENLDESVRFADLVQKNFVSVKRKDRSVKQNNFLVLRETVMPSVLIELGFLSNYKEGKFLNSRAGQKKLAFAIAKAIDAYIDQLRVNSVATIQTKKVEDVKTTQKNDLVKENQKTTVESKVKKVNEKEKIQDQVGVKIPVQKPITSNATTTIQNSSSATKKMNESRKVQEEKSIEFRVQIAASKKYLKPKSYNFKGLENITYRKLNGYYKYYSFVTSNYQEAIKKLKEIRKRGFSDAFMVSFQNGKKIPLKQAVNMR